MRFKMYGQYKTSIYGIISRKFSSFLKKTLFRRTLNRIRRKYG